MIESLYSKLPSYQPRTTNHQKDRKKKSLLRPGVDMKPSSIKAEIVKPTDAKNNITLHDANRNQNSFQILAMDDDDDDDNNKQEENKLSVQEVV